MIPTTQLMYNHEYAKRLYRGDAMFEDVWRGIVGIGGDFEKIYEEYIGYILEAIAKYSGYGWNESEGTEIPIYLIGQGESFAHPLSLAVHEDLETMLRDFVYQLTHRNMYFGFTDDQLKDQCITCVVDHVLRDTSKSKVDPMELDLDSITIREYLKTR